MIRYLRYYIGRLRRFIRSWQGRKLTHCPKCLIKLKKVNDFKACGKCGNGYFVFGHWDISETGGVNFYEK